MVSQVVKAIDQLAEVHEQLIQTGLAKKQAILSKELDELMRLMRIESKLSREITEMDQERSLVSRKLMMDKGVKNRFNVTYRNLMGVIHDPEERTELQRVHERLERAIVQLKQVNDLNQTLLQQSLDFIAFTIDLYLNPEDESYTYKHPASPTGDPKNKSGLYNTRA
ncbi:flagellar protein FlgN [Paenibacillus sp. GCM10023252]|uniref:flagellar protein FlgN n=1 Tax=Paenibacillus sp. GCM10023252 TaxID=3252649 RepID=UPI0036238F6C